MVPAYLGWQPEHHVQFGVEIEADFYVAQFHPADLEQSTHDNVQTFDLRHPDVRAEWVGRWRSHKANEIAEEKKGTFILITPGLRDEILNSHKNPRIQKEAEDISCGI